VSDVACGDLSRSDPALRELCELYREPIFRFLQRRCPNTEKAEDLTQGFIEHLLEKNRFEGFVRGQHKFRSFLLECLKRFCRDEWRREHAAKRAGGKEVAEIDELQIGQVVEIEKLLDLEIAKTTHYTALAKLRSEKSKGPQKQKRFETLYRFIWGKDGSVNYEKVGEPLQMTANHVKKAVFDLRQQYFESFRASVAQSVLPDVLEDETRYLLTLLGQSAASEL
jgi:RNA polymerase sigma-70 factor (ECF subfamily)